MLESAMRKVEWGGGSAMVSGSEDQRTDFDGP